KIAPLDSMDVYISYGDPNAASAQSFNDVFTTQYISNGSTTLKNSVAYAWFEVKKGDTVYIEGNKPVDILAGSIKIEGVIMGRGLGNPAGALGKDGLGTGGGKTSPKKDAAAGGAGYGGNGGDGAYDGGASVGAGGAAYGSPNSNSIEAGSGGGSSSQTMGGNGGAGVSL